MSYGGGYGKPFLSCLRCDARPLTLCIALIFSRHSTTTGSYGGGGGGGYGGGGYGGGGSYGGGGYGGGGGESWLEWSCARALTNEGPAFLLQAVTAAAVTGVSLKSPDVLLMTLTLTLKL